jgi:hypothetical protein
MHAAPVERGVASAAYSFVRFSGGAVAPWLAGYLGETVNSHVPYWVGASAVLLGVLVLLASRRRLAHIGGRAQHDVQAAGSSPQRPMVSDAGA